MNESADCEQVFFHQTFLSSNFTLRLNLFCSTSLPLARTRWVWSTFSCHCPKLKAVPLNNPGNIKIYAIKICKWSGSFFILCSYDAFKSKLFLYWSSFLISDIRPSWHELTLIGSRVICPQRSKWPVWPAISSFSKF